MLQKFSPFCYLFLTRAALPLTAQLREGNAKDNITSTDPAVVINDSLYGKAMRQQWQHLLRSYRKLRTRGSAEEDGEYL